ncbi:hypothetical protein BYT27DRAFT_7238179, partial [Phlegmacium glaucopus]
MSGIGPTPRTSEQVAADKVTAAIAKAAVQAQRDLKFAMLAEKEDAMQEEQLLRRLHASRPPTKAVQKDIPIDANKTMSTATTPCASEFGDDGDDEDDLCIFSDTQESEKEGLDDVDSDAMSKYDDDDDDVALKPAPIRKEKINARKSIQAKRLIAPDLNITPFNTTQDPKNVALEEAAPKRKRMLSESKPGGKDALDESTLRAGKKSKTNTLSAPPKNVKVGIHLGIKLKNAEKSARKVITTAEVDSAPAEIEAMYGGWSDEEGIDGEVERKAVAKSKLGKGPLGKSIAKVERNVVPPPKAPQDFGLRAMTTRTRFSQDSLPPTIKTLWNANPFILSDPVNLVQLVAKEVYADRYADLKKSQSLSPKGVIYELAIAISHTWRTGIKSAENKALREEFSDKERYPNKAAIADYVSMVTNPENLIFHWREYNDTVKKGSYEDPILMATFAFGHLKFIVGAHVDGFEEYPFTGMALSLAALECEYSLWKTGEWDKAHATAIDFSDNTYGSQASSYIKAMIGLKTKKWSTILSAAGNLLNHGGARKATGAYSGISSEGEMFDPRAAVDDSDEDEDFTHGKESRVQLHMAKFESQLRIEVETIYIHFSSAAKYFNRYAQTKGKVQILPWTSRQRYSMSLRRDFTYSYHDGLRKKNSCRSPPVANWGPGIDSMNDPTCEPSLMGVKDTEINRIHVSIQTWSIGNVVVNRGGGTLVAGGGSKIEIGGGSVRIPVHFCGVWILRASAGRFPMWGSGQAAGNLKDLHGFSKRVILANPWQYIYTTSDSMIPPSPACKRALKQVVSALKKQGHEVVDFRPPNIWEGLEIGYQLLFSDGGQITNALSLNETISPAAKSIPNLLQLPRIIKKILAFFVRSSDPMASQLYGIMHTELLPRIAESIVARDLYREEWHRKWTEE